MKTFLIEYLGRSCVFSTSLDKEVFSLYSNIKEVSYGKNIPVLDNNMVNNQAIRLFINKHFMIATKDFLTLHGICFQDWQGRNFLLGGKSGSGKSYVFQQLKYEKIIGQLFDEDLYNLSLDGDLFPLANQSFAGKSSSGKYLYQPSFLPSPGELSGVFILDTDILAFQHINLTTQIIQDYLIHENLEEIQTYYASCDTINSLQVPSYLIPNPHSGENLAFTFISQLLLGKNSS